MNKNEFKKSRHASTAIAAAMVVVPMLGMASPEAKQAKVESSTQVNTAPSQRSDQHWKFKSSFEKLKGEYWIAGVGDGHAIYKNSRGEYFYIDPATGDMKSVSADFVIKMSRAEGKSFVQKLASKVTLLGVDEQGNVIQKNTKGEKFYLNPATGDMVFVK